MTRQETLRRAREILAASRIDEAHLVGEVLLRQALNISRAELYRDPEDEPSPEQAAAFWRLIERSLTGTPAAYLTGHREFYGLDFRVDPAVLIPRPETERLVALALERAAKSGAATIADIGTGCGAIAVSLAVNLPSARIYATDISPAALEVARTNARSHGVSRRIEFLTGDLLAPLPGPVDLIVANPPYVKTAELAPPDFEPGLARDGGPDGLARIRTLCHQARGKLRPGGSLLMEVGRGQASPVSRLLKHLYPPAAIGVSPDLAGIDRVVSLTLPD
ncbi:MAG: peptide chain release factor N(5)-glutamine methyltransferase [Chloroflexota bacterium]